VHSIVPVGSFIAYSILLFDRFATPMCTFALVPVIMFTMLSSKVVIKRFTKHSSMLKTGLRAKA
jgi:hypothetical protein